MEIYKILNTYFKNEEDATKVVQDIQIIIDQKFEEKKETLATKEDIMRLENKLNENLKWTMATIIGMGGLIVGLIKFIR